MTKAEFTIMVARLILWIDKQGWYALLDYAKRSDEEQQRLYNLGLSKCDGLTKISAHQYGKEKDRFAADLYIHTDDGDIGKRELYEEAHQWWENRGGKPMISWDLGHFEV